jgi:hypothetical protein
MQSLKTACSGGPTKLAEVLLVACFMFDEKKRIHELHASYVLPMDGRVFPGLEMMTFAFMMIFNIQLTISIASIRLGFARLKCLSAER